MTAAARTVVLTRPAGRQDALLRHLHAVGVPCLDLPALALEPLPAAPDWPDAHEVDLVIFVSRLAVQCYLDARRATTPPDAHHRWPPGVAAAAVGAATAAALCSALDAPPAWLIHPPADDPGQDSEALWAMLAPFVARWQTALIVRGEQGREWLGQQLEAAGLSVSRLSVYRRLPAVWTAAQDQALVAAARGGGCRILLTSREGVDAFHGHWRRLRLNDLWAAQQFVVTHARIADHVAAVADTAPPAQAVRVVPPDEASLMQVLAMTVPAVHVLQSSP